MAGRIVKMKKKAMSGTGMSRWGLLGRNFIGVLRVILIPGLFILMAGLAVAGCVWIIDEFGVVGFLCIPIVVAAIVAVGATISGEEV